jgi:hypothetical protein
MRGCNRVEVLFLISLMSTMLSVGKLSTIMSKQRDQIEFPVLKACVPHLKD